MTHSSRSGCHRRSHVTAAWYHPAVIKFVSPEVWAFDLEWVPDPESGRRVYGLPESLDDRAVMEEMWQRGGATAEDPRPFLKTVVCRVVSVSAVIRKRDPQGHLTHTLHSLPPLDEPGPHGEADLLARFMGGIGKHKPQLVGFNSQSADLPILLQRALAHGLSLPEFCHRPDKPWEGVDYFARSGDHHLDLKELFCGRGRATPSLHELATVCGIPGKLHTSALDVADLWLAGDLPRIVQYNECDAITTFLVWLRAALLAGHLTPAAYAQEVADLDALLESKTVGGAHHHLREYLDAWRVLRGAVAPVAPVADSSDATVTTERR